ERSQQRPETADQRIEIERRPGPFDGDRRAGRQRPAIRARLQLQIAVADQVLIADRRGGGGEQRHRVVDGELDAHRAVAAADGDADHLADLDTGGPDELTGAQTADIAELGGVAHGAVEPDLAEHDDDQRGEQQQDRREDAQPDRHPGDSHGLMVSSPPCRPQTYSATIGRPSSKWLYGAIEAPVSMTSHGAGHSSRVISCQQPGLPPGPPLAFTRGRLSGYR